MIKCRCEIGTEAKRGKGRRKDATIESERREDEEKPKW